MCCMVSDRADGTVYTTAGDARIFTAAVFARLGRGAVAIGGTWRVDSVKCARLCHTRWSGSSYLCRRLKLGRVYIESESNSFRSAGRKYFLFMRSFALLRLFNWSTIDWS